MHDEALTNTFAIYTHSITSRLYENMPEVVKEVLGCKG